LRLLESESRVDLLFTDVGLPAGMSGRQLTDQARLRRPHLKILFTTGHERNAIVHQGRLEPDVERISKPFTYNQLAAKIRKILKGDSDAKSQM
jgi:CheY-like chemotaxis protein